MHRIEVMCDCVITISGAVCANVRKTISLRLSLFFIANSLLRSSHHVSVWCVRVRAISFCNLYATRYKCYLLVMRCNCTELLTLHEN